MSDSVDKEALVYYAKITKKSSNRSVFVNIPIRTYHALTKVKKIGSICARTIQDYYPEILDLKL